MKSCNKPYLYLAELLKAFITCDKCAEQSRDFLEFRGSVSLFVRRNVIPYYVYIQSVNVVFYERKQLLKINPSNILISCADAN